MNKDRFISIWGSMAALAREISEGETTVRNWFGRGSIPFRYDKKIIAAATAAGVTLTHEDLFLLREDIAARTENAA